MSLKAPSSRNTSSKSRHFSASKLRALKVTFGVMAVLISIIALGTTVLVFPTASQLGYAPEQPIPFSHKVHAGINKIPCNYCHSTVDKSRHASIPSSNVCLNCHNVVKVDSPWIQQLKKLTQEGKAIQWVRVHELPDYVYFSHKRHIAKGLACENCHGDVKGMDKIVQTQHLTMGWCMECHRGVTTPPKVWNLRVQDINNGKLGSWSNDRWPAAVAPTDCNTCHN